MGKKEEENIRKITEAELAMAHAGWKGIHSDINSKLKCHRRLDW